MDAKMLKAADFLGKVIREAAEHKTKLQVYIFRKFVCFHLDNSLFTR